MPGILWLLAFGLWFLLVGTFALLCTTARDENESRWWGAAVVATIAAGILAAPLSDSPAVY
jgi:hypothetical protein